MPIQRWRNSNTHHSLVMDDEGGWVRYQDHETELAQLRAENERLTAWRSFDTAPEDPETDFLIWEEAHYWQKEATKGKYTGHHRIVPGRPRNEWQHYPRWKGWQPLPTPPDVEGANSNDQTEARP